MTFIFNFAHLCFFQNVFHKRYQGLPVLIQFPDFIRDVLLQLFQNLRFVNIHIPFEMRPQEELRAGQVCGTQWPVDIVVARDNPVSKTAFPTALSLLQNEQFPHFAGIWLILNCLAQQVLDHDPVTFSRHNKSVFIIVLKKKSPIILFAVIAYTTANFMGCNFLWCVSLGFSAKPPKKLQFCLLIN